MLKKILIAAIIVLIVILVMVEKNKLEKSAKSWLSMPPGTKNAPSVAPATTLPPSPTRPLSVSSGEYALSVLAPFIAAPSTPQPLFGFSSPPTLIMTAADKTLPLASIWANSQMAVVAFRGTLTAADLVADLHFSQTVEFGGAKVHGGMYAFYEAVRGELLAAIPPTVSQVFVTGHSLGSALAAIFAVDLAAATAATIELFVFAPPRVGDAAFVSLVNSACRYESLINIADMIPTLPWSYMPTTAAAPYTPDQFATIAPFSTFYNLQPTILQCHLLPAYAAAAAATTS